MLENFPLFPSKVKSDKSNSEKNPIIHFTTISINIVVKNCIKMEKKNAIKK